MSGRGKTVDLELVSFLLDFFTSYCFVICTVGRTSNHGRAHIRCLIPAHTCVCKRDTAAGSTSKNNPILSILKEVFLLMLFYVLRKKEKKNEKTNKKTYGLLGSGECVCVCMCVCGGGGGVG